MTLAQLNVWAEVDFVRWIGPVFEHSPWIAAAAAAQRPFASTAEMHRILCEVVRTAGPERQLALIRAHPDLVGRLAQQGRLTADSTREQASAGLDQLTPDEVALFQRYNAAYHEMFGFPFVICARLNKKAAILAGFEIRLRHSPELEIATALEEIFKIAQLRLEDLVTG